MEMERSGTLKTGEENYQSSFEYVYNHLPGTKRFVSSSHADLRS